MRMASPVVLLVPVGIALPILVMAEYSYDAESSDPEIAFVPRLREPPAMTDTRTDPNHAGVVKDTGLFVVSLAPVHAVTAHGSRGYQHQRFVEISKA